MTTKTTTRKATGKKAPKKATPPKQLRVTPVSAWEEEVDDLLELPSGKVVRINSIGFQTFMKMGLVPNSLMGIVQSAVNKGTEPEVDDLVGDSQSLNDLLQMIDSIVMEVVVEPRIQEPPRDPAERQKGVLYLDRVADDDKMFIFGVTTGGTRDVETFRVEARQLLGAVQ